MNIVVVGGGGREHAIVKKLRENPGVKTIWALPGNGGLAKDAICLPIDATDLNEIVRFVERNQVDYVVVSPDDPLVLGLSDRIAELGVPCFGPSARAAAIEGSKFFSKDLMRRYGIPTAKYEAFDRMERVISYLKTASYPVVVKADGLARGKGVRVCANMKEAQNFVAELMMERIFGNSGDRVIIEECLEGPEVSVLAFTDGEAVLPLVSAMDHKRALDGDHGPNTGGMGVIAPNPFYTEEIARRCMDEIFLPTVRAMRAEERPFRGCLFFGLMLTKDGPKVIEYNCRFGDPEAQAVLPLLKTDLLTVMRAVSEGRLSEVKLEFYEGASCCVVIASGGYPGFHQNGLPISLGRAAEAEGVSLFHAGTGQTADGLVTAGGRLLGVTAVGATLEEAISKAYRAAGEIKIPKSYYRRDIGKKALTGGK